MAAEITRDGRAMILMAMVICGLLFPVVGSAQAQQDVLSPGVKNSHEMFLLLLARDKERNYQGLLRLYDEHMRNHPGDFTAAVERCKFIDKAFMEGAEDSNPKQEEFDACVTDLKKTFPDEPRVLLYRLDLLYGTQALDLARTILAGPMTQWTREEKGIFLERMAWLYYAQGDLKQASARASEALQTDGRRDVGAILGEAEIKLGNRDSAIQALTYGVEWASPQSLARRMKSLVTLGAYREAISVIERLDQLSGHWVEPLLRLKALEGAGQIERTRQGYAEHESKYWNKKELRKQAFYFELRHGDRESASSAYDRLRDLGWDADPLARHRLALLFSFPTDPWHVRDWFGFVAFVALLMLFAMFPLLWVVPVHYISLLRKKSEIPASSGVERWTIGHLWYASGLLVVFGVITSYSFLYDDLEFLIFGTGTVSEGSGEAYSDAGALAHAALFGSGLLLVGTALILRRSDYRAFLTCDWSIGHVIGTILLCMLCLSLIAKFNLELIGGNPNTRTLGAITVAGQDSLTFKMFKAIGTKYGFLALLVYAAVLVPLYEEILFREVILNSCSRYLSFLWANLIQAGLFAVFHEEISLALFYAAMGVISGLLRKHSGGLVPSVLVHAGNNTLVVMALALAPKTL